jgi:predicted enzyme related to lactoylglutathione lyase
VPDVVPGEPDGWLGATAADRRWFGGPVAQPLRQIGMFYVDDAQAEYDRTKGLGANFTMPPAKVTGATIAQAEDTCGNLIQIVALDRSRS